MSYAKIRPRRSTRSEWELINPILMDGELGIEVPDTGVGTGLCKFKIGDGNTSWTDLPYAFDASGALNIDGGSVSTSHYILLRRGTTEEWEELNPILENGELVYDETKQALKVGDGITRFTNLEYIGYFFDENSNYDFGDLEDVNYSYLNNLFSDQDTLSNNTLNNILLMCINSTRVPSINRKLTYLGLTSTKYPASTIQSLSNYNDFISAGWTIGYQ